MALVVVQDDSGHRLDGDGPITEVANRFLAHLRTRGFSPGTIRGYAFDLLNFSRFLAGRGASLADVVPTDLFDYLDWQAKPRPSPGAKVVRPGDRRGAAPATMNRRIAAVRGLFESVDRGWDSEVARHARVIASIEGHLRRLKNSG